MLTITGGKLTTWRRMAKQVVDRMVEREGRRGALPHRRHPARAWRRSSTSSTRPRASPSPTCPPGYRELLGFRYGHFARNVLRLAGERPELAAPIVEGQPDLLAEAVIAARLEQARSVADVLLRRTRLGLLAAPQLRDRRLGAARSRRRWAGSSAGTRRAWMRRPSAGSPTPRPRGSTRRRRPSARPRAAGRAAPLACAADGHRAQGPAPRRPARARGRGRDRGLPAAAPRAADRAALRGRRGLGGGGGAGAGGSVRGRGSIRGRGGAGGAGERGGHRRARGGRGDGARRRRGRAGRGRPARRRGRRRARRRPCPRRPSAACSSSPASATASSGSAASPRPTATSTSPRPRCAAASCATATRSPAPPGSPGAASAIRRWSTSTRSTARSRSTEVRPEFDDLAPVLPERRIPLDGARRRRPPPRRRPARPARVRPAGPGPRRAALGPDDPAALDRPRRGERGHGEGDRGADRRAARGGDRVARGGAGRRVRDRDRRAGAGRAGADGRAGARARPPARRGRDRHGPRLRLAHPARDRRRRRRPRSSACSAPAATSPAAAR